MFEFACSLHSQMGFTNEENSTKHVRRSKDRIELGDESPCEQLDYQIDAAAEAAPPHLRASIPCTSASPWQYINRKKLPCLRPGSADIYVYSKCIAGSSGLVALQESLIRACDPGLIVEWRGSLCLVPQKMHWPCHDGCPFGYSSGNHPPMAEPFRLVNY